MTFERPRLPELFSDSVGDIQTRLPGADAQLPRSNLAVLAAVIAGGEHGLYGELDFLSKQLFPDTAEDEYLDRWASFWGITREVPTYATGTITLTGNIDNVIEPAGSLYTRQDGAVFVTQADATIIGGTAVSTVTAQVPGSAGNTAAATVLTRQVPIATIQAGGIVGVNGLSGGNDTEEDPSLLSRLLFRIQNPPQGGALADYTAWASSVAGVTRVWPIANGMGPGTVVVYFVMDGRANIFPLVADVAAVQAYINTVRPITAQVTVVAPNPIAQNFTIHLNPDTLVIRAAIQTALADLISREATPGGTILLSHILQAIESATSGGDSVVSVPAANVVSATGNMTSLGIITWI
jgi:uncharacterized phage protein gp47/JayE